MKRIFLYGAPAAGKTTLGGKLAKALGVRHVDLDDAIVAKCGAPIAELFAQTGERAFRELERTTLSALVASRDSEGAVISLGGGTLLDAESRRLCEANGEVLCLDTPSLEELQRRLAKGGASRPLGDRAVERAEHYASFSRRITSSFEVAGSLVVVGEGISKLALARFPRVADADVEARCRDALADCGEPLATLHDGERGKTIETVASLWHAFAAAGIGRRDVVAAFGGGVTGDLTGFAAATWMRGVDWVNVPTSLLAMVDASVGGKTGCDLPEGKNLAGAFHLPRLVIVDVGLLKTLPPREFAAGRAEMVKHEIIANLPRTSSPVPTASEITASLAVKAKLVNADPLELTGERLLLNCGHTVAHALEKASGYRISHGEAVAIGCVEEARLAVASGLAHADWPNEVAARMREFSLPVALPDGFTFESLKPFMAMDKKRVDAKLVFALPCGWGDVRRFTQA